MLCIVCRVVWCVKGRAGPISHGLSVGMKLEALHPLTRRDICPATVVAVFDQCQYVVEFDELAPTDFRDAAKDKEKENAQPAASASVWASLYVFTAKGIVVLC